MPGKEHPVSKIYSQFGKNVPTPQSQPILGEDQVKNNAGGYVYEPPGNVDSCRSSSR